MFADKRAIVDVARKEAKPAVLVDHRLRGASVSRNHANLTTLGGLAVDVDRSSNRHRTFLATGQHCQSKQKGCRDKQSHWFALLDFATVSRGHGPVQRQINVVAD